MICVDVDVRAHDRAARAARPTPPACARRAGRRRGCRSSAAARARPAPTAPRRPAAGRPREPAHARARDRALDGRLCRTARRKGNRQQQTRSGPRGPLRYAGSDATPAPPPLAPHPLARRARLRARADDAHPRAHRARQVAQHRRQRRRLDAHRLPARGRRLHPGLRPPRRHVRQAPPARRRARHLRRRLGRLRARHEPRGRRRRPRPPGRRRRHLPALLRDHPRRVPAREGRLEHRPDLRHVRHRRRRRPDPRRRCITDHASLPLDLLARRGHGGARGGRHELLRPRVARPHARPRRRPRRGRARRRAGRAAARDRPGQRLGLGRPAHARPVRRRRRRSSASGSGSQRRTPRAARRHRDCCAQPPVADDQLRDAARRLRHVRLVHPDPAARRGAGVDRLRLRARRPPAPAC